KGDQKICCDTDLDQACVFVFATQTPENQCGREGNDLCHKKCQKQSGRIQAQSSSVGGCHVNDGVHAVDVEEKGNQEEEHLLVFLQFSEHMAETAKSRGDCMIVVFDTVQLFVASKKRYRKADPPDSDEQKCNAHGQVHRDSQRFVKENQSQAD